MHEETLTASLIMAGAVNGTTQATTTTTANEAISLSNPQILHSTGVQVDIDLPQIAVIGNQSTGKSSLIESISGQSHNEPFGPVIYDKKEVKDRIQRAQLVILNPDQSAASFLDDDELGTALSSPGEASSLTFLMNCISLAISGPDVADLSFVDLLGLIASVGCGGNSGDIKLVEGLITSYIKKANCIILLMVACERALTTVTADFENQGAHQLAKQFNAEGKQTIEPLENNWFCVKQPSSNNLKQNWTWEQAQKKEDEFFLSMVLWNELEVMYTRYLGTGNLLERLSGVLLDLIAKQLLEIQQEIEGMVAKTWQQIALLPKPPPQNALNEVAKLIKDFNVDMRQCIESVPYKEGIVQQIRIPCDQFRHDIHRTAPEFHPFEEPHFVTPKSLAAPEFLQHKEEGGGDNEDEVETPAPEYIKEAVAKWECPAIWLCDEVYVILTELMKGLVHQHFSTFRQGMLEHQIW
ncbi:hypothetical protein P691DRAFT_788503 [Macrolepiota fuliginosa MF-IS2]|uniref:Dynamin GTPase domain-containing protein n=1 Tax=Macrolepiota fuliginosa MF-IS2 TaxID=1400762 RepID=A0A9P6BWM9_9AGAR|nr:hypothetical protein P691DRAFT_788503 [Macrolepiota fuliginosa MF-IS2]